MPTYEYRCENGHGFEAFQSMSEDPLTSCEVCNAPVQRVLHAPAVHFKGSGFYTTDYKNKTPKKASADAGSASKNTSGASGESGGSGGDSKKSDSAKSNGGESKKTEKASGSK